MLETATTSPLKVFYARARRERAKAVRAAWVWLRTKIRGWAK